MRKVLIAIDPGSESGGIAFRVDGDPKVGAVNMPDTPHDIYEFLRDLKSDGSATCILENVGGSRPGNSASSALKFAKHVGHLEMALLVLEISVIKITPSKWMHGILTTVPKEKPERKRAIKAKMQEVFPYIKVTLDKADALGLLWYHETKGGV